MKTKILCICYVVVFSLLMSCQTKDEKADKLRCVQKYTEAASVYKESAQEGSAYAKWRLGLAYIHGQGVEYDEAKGLELIKQAADEGCEEAIYDLGNAYIDGSWGLEKNETKGEGMISELWDKTDNDYCKSYHAFYFITGNSWIDKDEDRGLEILNSIKDKNNPIYLWTKGMITYEGLCGEKKDPIKGIEYFKKSFEAGLPAAANRVAINYYYGAEGVEKNIPMSIDWWQKGIKGKNIKSMLGLTDLYLSNDTSLSKYRDVSKGLELLETAGKLGSGEAYARLGWIYEYGDDVTKNDKKAFQYYQKSYELKSGWGTNNLAVQYENGFGCQKDVKRAIQLYKEAAELGVGRAHYNLYRYYHGNLEISDTIDNDLAKSHLEKAAELEEPYALCTLGHHYYQGSNLYPQNKFQAFIYYKNAADSGYVEAAECVAYMYANGIGTDKDPDKAKEYKDMTKAKSTEENHGAE